MGSRAHICLCSWKIGGTSGWTTKREGLTGIWTPLVLWAPTWVNNRSTCKGVTSKTVSISLTRAGSSHCR